MDLQKLTREWAKARGKASLARLPGTAIHLRPETVAAILQESKKTKRPVGAIVRDDIELARWVRGQAERDRELAGALERFFVAERVP